jgi:hypothetical protein
MDEHPKRHSFFWPALLIGVGLVWLLVNFNVIEPFRIGSLLQFWPLLLVLLGLDILFGRRYAWVGGVFGAIAVVFVVAVLIFGARLGLTTNSQYRVDTYTEPLGEAESVEYNFETSSEAVKLSALGDPSKLIDATIYHNGTMTFNVTGSTQKTVRLYENTDSSAWFSWNPSFNNRDWEIGLNSTIPSEVLLDGGSGSIEADLSGIKLESLSAELASGSSNFVLPESVKPQTLIFDSGSGSVDIDLPANTSVTLKLSSGSGSVDINLPAGAEVRIEVRDSGSGSLNLPDFVSRTSGDVETGTWQTSGYSSAANPILIQITNRGSGSINID